MTGDGGQRDALVVLAIGKDTGLIIDAARPEQALLATVALGAGYRRGVRRIGRKARLADRPKRSRNSR